MADFGTSMAAQLAATALTMAVQKISKVISLGADDQKLRKKLIELQALFMDTHRAFYKQESRSLELWIRDLQDAALDAEDAVELYAAVTSSGSSAVHSSFGLVKSLAKYVRKLKSFIELNSLCSEFRRINQTFDRLEARAGLFLSLHRMVIEGASDSLLSDMNSWKNSEIIFEESISVDLDYKVDQIVNLIQQHKVVAVVGMGGSGKTRLLQQVSKSLSLKNKYEKCIWLCVSQIYSIKQLQLDVLNRLERLDSTDQGSSVTVLYRKIYNEMREKDCLVVLDDVWDLPEAEQAQGANVAQKLRSIGFPTDGNRCSVLISTRDCKVAEQFDSHQYAMPLLPDDKSYDLLCKRLLPHPEFGEMVFTEPQDELIKKFLKKCGGLPLAIVVVAGIMKHQHPDQWESTLKNMAMSTSASSSSSLVTASASEVPQSAVIIALRLSFNALEFKVKPCFAFLGVFAEDEEIESEMLIGMWLAEGLVECEEDGLLMLKHLSNRCLLNMNHKKGYPWSTSRMYSITVHDLVHGLAMTVYKESGGICQGSSSDEAFARELQSGRRLLRIHFGNSSLDQIPNSFRCPRSVRLLRFSYSDGVGHIPEETLANARALRTLLFTGYSEVTSLPSLPKCVSQLRIIKFLDMSGSRIRRLPTCLRQLKHLQYLYTAIKGEVSAWVEELQSLTHFSADGYDCKWKKVNVNQIMPRSLKVVRGIDIEIGGGTRKKKTWRWEDVAELTQLQEVELVVHNNVESGVLPPRTLESLVVKRGSAAAVTIPHEWAQHLHKLEVLKLRRGVEFSRQGVEFPKLQCLSLWGDYEEYRADICKLPELRHLYLRRNSKCKLLPHEFGSAAAFPKLLTLKLEVLSELCMLPAIHNGAMPCLARLDVRFCEKLREAGCGWDHKIRTLKEVHITGVDPALETQLPEAFQFSNSL